MTPVEHEAELPGPDADTFWNGEPCLARQVVVTVADAPDFPMYWARPYVGTDRDAVEIRYSGHLFYLDDEGHAPSEKEAEFLRERGVEAVESDPGAGWAKVTLGRGGPRWAHRELAVEPDSVRPRDDVAEGS